VRLHAGEEALELRAVETTLSGDEGAARREPGNGELEVRGVARAVGVEEGEIERSREGQRVGGGPLPHVHPRGDAGALESTTGDAGETAGWVIAIRIGSETTR
jgi:hypothetical protein